MCKRRPEHCGVVFCSALFKKKKKEVISRTVKKRSPVTHKEEKGACGGELCWSNSFLCSAESAGTDKKTLKKQNKKYIEYWREAKCLTSLKATEVSGVRLKKKREKIVHNKNVGQILLTDETIQGGKKYKSFLLLYFQTLKRLIKPI